MEVKSSLHDTWAMCSNQSVVSLCANQKFKKKKRNIKWKYSTVVQVLEICCIWINPLRCNILFQGGRESWGSGRYWEGELESRRFSNVGRSKEGKTTVLQCLLYVCVFMHISWNYDIEVCLNLPLPYRPAARSFKPTWANMKNHTNIHSQTHTHSMAPWPYADECLSFSDHKSHSRVIQSEWGQTKQERKRCRESGDKAERGRKKMELRV